MTRKFFAVLLAAALALPVRAETILAQDPSRKAKVQRTIRRPPPAEVQPCRTFPIICALYGGCDLVLQAAFVLAEGRVIINASVVSIGHSPGVQAERCALCTRPRAALRY